MDIERTSRSRSRWPFAARRSVSCPGRGPRHATLVLLATALVFLCACSGSSGSVAVCVNCKPKPPEADKPGGLTVLVTRSFGFPLADRTRARDTAADSTGNVPPRLSETGLFADLASLTADPALLEYALNHPTRNQGARVRHWLALPTARAVSLHPTGPWEFPVGSVAVQHFELDLAIGARQRVETRVMVLTHEGWRGYTYAWQPHQLDAELLQQSRSATHQVLDTTQPTGQRSVDWHYPSRADCLGCHDKESGWILGLRTRQVNRDFRYRGVVENQLEAFNRIGVFNRDIGSHTMYGTL